MSSNRLDDGIFVWILGFLALKSIKSPIFFEITSFCDMSLKREDVENKINKLRKKIDDLGFEINLDTDKNTIKVRKELRKKYEKEIVELHKSLCGRHNRWTVVEPELDTD